MLTRLEVDGFKSLQDLVIDLEPFTVLVGPNSAGKSNILEAIALLSRLETMRPVEALQRGRGLIIDQFTRVHGVSAERIAFAVEGFDDTEPDLPPPDGGPDIRYRHVFALLRDEGGASPIKHEILSTDCIKADQDTWLRSHPEFGPYASHDHPERIFADLDLRDESSIQIDLHGPKLRLSCERLAARRLLADASNLPAALAALPPPVLGEVRAALSAIIPGVASFDVLREGDMLSLEFTLSGGDRVPARIASDGTLRVLALLTAAFAPRAPRTICIEEPENGIYPRRLRDLLQLLHARTRPREGQRLPPQVIVTTHSPVAIAALKDSPECVRFVDTVRRNGQRVTRVRKIGTGEDHGRTTVSPQEIAELLDIGSFEDDV